MDNKEIKEDLNPIGIPKQINELELKVKELLDNWKKENPVKKELFGLISNVKISFNKITAFLINSLDEFIQIVDDKLDNGSDKKATVMLYVEKLYDEIVTASLPVFLKPFNLPIKRFVVLVVISGTIDFVVSKYRNGAWRNKWNDLADDAEDGILNN